MTRRLGQMFLRLKIGAMCVLVAGVVCADEPSAERFSAPEVAAKELAAVLRDGIVGKTGASVGELIQQEFWNDPTASAPSAILVPGLFAGDDSMSRIRTELSRNRIATATFQYADQLPIDQVAAGLRSVLDRLQRDQPQRSICLVTHSLGGIVARAAIESDSDPSCGVKRLIMIAPPNHGTALASLNAAEISDCVEALGGQPVNVSVINQVVDGFVGDAKESLQPGSVPLAKLNARPRAEGVEYTIIAGTGGPIHREWIELPLLVSELLLGSDADQQKAMAPLRRLVTTEEWMHGLGDGVVSLKSTQLHRVADFASFPFGHNDFGSQSLTPDRREAVDQAVRLIVRRIKQADN